MLKNAMVTEKELKAEFLEKQAGIKQKPNDNSVKHNYTDNIKDKLEAKIKK